MSITGCDWLSRDARSRLTRSIYGLRVSGLRIGGLRIGGAGMMDPCLPGQIADSGQWYQQEPPEGAPPAAFFAFFGRRRRLAIEFAGQSIPVSTVRPQRVPFGSPSEQIVHIVVTVFHN
jgi:hypothetical protein